MYYYSLQIKNGIQNKKKYIKTGANKGCKIRIDATGNKERDMEDATMNC
jgi:hypothetical protein